MDAIGPFSAAVDQLGEFIRVLAPTVAAYYRALREAGVPETVAGELTGRVQLLLLAKIGITP